MNRGILLEEHGRVESQWQSLLEVENGKETPFLMALHLQKKGSCACAIIRVVQFDRYLFDFSSPIID